MEKASNYNHIFEIYAYIDLRDELAFLEFCLQLTARLLKLSDLQSMRKHTTITRCNILSIYKRSELPNATQHVLLLASFWQNADFIFWTELLQTCDMNYKITSICVQAGSNNDRYIWNLSHLKTHMERLRENEDVIENEGMYFLIGMENLSSCAELFLDCRNVISSPPTSPPTHYLLSKYCHCVTLLIYTQLKN